MARKKQPSAPQKQEFNRSPFSSLKGFAVSGEEPMEHPPPTTPAKEVREEKPSSFAEEMAQLGVKRINTDQEGGDRELSVEMPPAAETQQPLELSEEEQFLCAMGELQVNFSDQLPEDKAPPTASPRRMKQLKQGKLTPEATLDLHGLKRTDVAEKLQFFLQKAARRNWQTLLVVTGRGLHSVDGEPVLRSEAELYLATEGGALVAEWGRAPKQYGGDGALVLFLRSQAK